MLTCMLGYAARGAFQGLEPLAAASQAFLLPHTLLNLLLSLPPCRSGRAARAGRSGTSYSFVTREETPYLLDLHLYLGRTLVPAPQTPDAEAVRAAAAHGVAGVSSGGG
jgi:hypothetical protein